MILKAESAMAISVSSIVHLKSCIYDAINYCYYVPSSDLGYRSGPSTTLHVGRTRDRFQVVTLGIYSVAADISVCPRVDSASKNEYQDIPGGKGGRRVRVTTLPPSCAECLVIWSLNRPEPSGPHRPVIRVAFCFFFNVPSKMPDSHKCSYAASSLLGCYTVSICK